MQTFLPYSSFFISARCLDTKRLGKQRLEASQILNILLGTANPGKNGKIGWVNHPAVKMWRGYEIALANYYNTILDEWIHRGYRNTMLFRYPNGQLIYPHWLGNSHFHSSHRSNLLRKNFEYYSQFCWNEDPNAEYVWPIN